MARLEEQVLSIEQMNHLKGFGVDTKNASVVLIYKDDERYLTFEKERVIYLSKFVSGAYGQIFEGVTLIESAFKALCWCAKNGYLNKE